MALLPDLKTFHKPWREFGFSGSEMPVLLAWPTINLSLLQTPTFFGFFVPTGTAGHKPGFGNSFILKMTSNVTPVANRHWEQFSMCINIISPSPTGSVWPLSLFLILPWAPTEDLLKLAWAYNIWMQINFFPRGWVMKNTDWSEKQTTERKDGCLPREKPDFPTILRK